MKIYCSCAFDEQLWLDLKSEMDIFGTINMDDNQSSVQLMPIDEFNFMPGTDAVIEFCLDIASQIAMGLLVNWLYDKLKQHKIEKIKINKTQCDVIDKAALEESIKSEITSIK